MCCFLGAFPLVLREGFSLAYNLPYITLSMLRRWTRESQESTLFMTSQHGDYKRVPELLACDSGIELGSLCSRLQNKLLNDRAISSARFLYFSFSFCLFPPFFAKCSTWNCVCCFSSFFPLGTHFQSHISIP